MYNKKNLSERKKDIFWKFLSIKNTSFDKKYFKENISQKTIVAYSKRNNYTLCTLS